MRTEITALFIALALTASASADPAEDDEAVRDPHNVLFEGAASFDVEQIRKRLALDIDVQVAGHPKNPLPNYLKQLEQVLVSGYRVSGFPKARAEARFDPKQRQVIVRVQEGPRYRCSSVRISGLDPSEYLALISHLTCEGPPHGAVAIDVPRDDGTAQTVWETISGSAAKLAGPVWPVGEPASFDKGKLVRVEDRVKEWLWDRGRGYADFRASIRPEAGSDKATLVVTFDDPGITATIGEIVVKGAKINSEQEVLNFLDIQPGMPYDARLEADLHRRLWESGRFIESSIKKTTTERTLQGARVGLTVVVVEHPHLSPLTAPLPPYQQALLNLRDWVMHWTEGVYDEDLVLDAEIAGSFWDEEDEHPKTEQKPKSPEKICKIHVVTSPAQGQVISIQIKQEEKVFFSQTFIARDQRAIFHSPLTRTYLEFEHSNYTQLISDFGLKAEMPKSAKEWGTSINFGLGVWSNSTGSATPLKVRFKLSPTAILRMSKGFNEVDCRRNAGIITMRADELNVQIDEQTGRPVQLQGFVPDFGNVRLRIVRGALQQEFDRQERLLAGSKNVYNRKRPGSSLAVYWVDEYRRFRQHDLTPEQAESLAALHKLCRNWQIEPAGELIRQVDNLDLSDDAFYLPTKDIKWGHPALSILDFDGAGTLAGYLLPMYRELVPKTGWLWPLGRDGLFAAIGRPTGTYDQIGEYQQVVDSGPIGHLTGALALAPFSPATSQKLAKHGISRLTPKSLRVDYAPFLAGDSWLGRNMLSLAEALRSLDDGEITALVRLLPDEKHHRQIADSLRLLKADPRKPVRDVLPAVCEKLWQSAAKPPVESALKTLSAGKSLPAPRALKDAKFERTSGSK